MSLEKTDLSESNADLYDDSPIYYCTKHPDKYRKKLEDSLGMDM